MAFWTSSALLPKTLTLSLMARMATSAMSAALAVSPPRELMSAAENDVACCMYWLALIPLVWYACAAYCCSFPEASPKSLSTPPTICSYVE